MLKSIRFYAALLVLVCAAVVASPALILCILAMAIYPGSTTTAEDDEPEGPEGDEANLDPPSIPIHEGAWVDQGHQVLH